MKRKKILIFALCGALVLYPAQVFASQPDISQDSLGNMKLSEEITSAFEQSDITDSFDSSGLLPNDSSEVHNETEGTNNLDSDINMDLKTEFGDSGFSDEEILNKYGVDFETEKDVENIAANIALFGTDLDTIYGSMREGLLKGEDVSFSSILNEYGSFQIPTESVFGLEDLDLSEYSDFGNVNFQYTVLAMQMQNDYAAVDMSGLSKGCESLFNSTYGHMDLTLESGYLDGFNVSTMLNDEKTSIANTYEDALSSSLYSDVKGIINIGSVFAKANNGVSASSLLSGSELSSIISGTSAANKSEISGQYKDRNEVLQDRKEKLQQDTVANMTSTAVGIAKGLESASQSISKKLSQLDNPGWDKAQEQQQKNSEAIKNSLSSRLNFFKNKN